MIGRVAPILRTFKISPEAVAALGQSEDCLPIGITGFVITGVGAAIEGIDLEARFGCSTRLLNSHCERFGHRDSDRFTARQGAVIFASTPELGAVHIGPETVVAGRQSEGRLAAGVAGLVVS